MQSVHDHAMLPQRPATGLAENASLYLYSEYQDKLRELAARLAALDAGLQSHLLPRCGSKKKWCLALAFSTPYLLSLYEGGAAAAGAGCPAALLREDVCRRAGGCALSPAQVVAASRDVVLAVQREWPDLDTDALLPAHHEATFAAATGDALALLCLDDALVQRLRAYHGEEVGGYFLYLVSYQRWLVPAALVGALLFFMPLGQQQGARLKDLLALALPPGVARAYAFLLPVWMVVALKVWGWAQDRVRAAWVQPQLQITLPAAAAAAAAASGSGGASPAGRPRRARGAASAASPRAEKPWSVNEGARMLALLPLLALYAGLSFAGFLYCGAAGEAAGSPLLAGVLQMAVHWFFAELTAVAVAERSAEFVVGDGAGVAEARESLALRIELLLSELILQAPFLHMAFVARDMAGVRSRLLSFLGVWAILKRALAQQVTPWLQAKVLPHLSYRWLAEQAAAAMARRHTPEAEAARAAAAAEEAAQAARDEAEVAHAAAAFAEAHAVAAARGSDGGGGAGVGGGAGGGAGGVGVGAGGGATAGTPIVCTPPLSRAQRAALKLAASAAYDLPAFNPDEEHKQLYTQLVLIALWGATFPLAPLLCLASNMLELWVDSTKMLRLRRCTFGGEGSEGTMVREARWSAAIKGVAYVACAMNAALMVAAAVGKGGACAAGAPASAGSSSSGSSCAAAGVDAPPWALLAWGGATAPAVVGAFALEHAAFVCMAAVEIALPQHFVEAVTALPAAPQPRKRAKAQQHAE